MSFTTYDFSETHKGAGFPREDIERVEAAHGENGDGNEWSGGFIMRMKDGRRVYISGWCDYTGWGCQDGTNVEVMSDDAPLPPDAEGEWETDPADLNRYVQTGEGGWD
jgi:hypothetical protein